jgi:hypothetical protein
MKPHSDETLDGQASVAAESALRASGMLRHLTPHMRAYAQAHDMRGVDTLWLCVFLIKATCQGLDMTFEDAHATLADLYKLDAMVADWHAKREQPK